MRRTVGVAVLALLLLSSVGAVTMTASAADIAIRSVNTSVDQPAPGEPFTLSVELANLQSSSGPVDITDVYVRGPDGDEYARAENLGTVAAGTSLTVPVTVRIDDAGRARLTVYAVVRGPDGGFTRVSYPLFVDVERPDEAVVSFADLDPVAGEESAVNVTVSNGDSGALSNVRLDLGGDAVVENPERVNASLRAGTQTTYAYDVTFPEAGEATLNATLTYKTDQGSTRTTDRAVTTDVEAANLDADLTATGTQVNGSPALRASLTEYGNVELRNVQLRAVVDGSVVARTLVPNVPAEGTRTVTLDGSDVPAGEVTLVARYTAAGEPRTSNATLRYSPRETSNVALTGVEATRAGSTIALSGDVANLGSMDANSVLVGVADAGGVSPTAPNGEYFVGTVESSEFATFELSAAAGANASVERVPVEVSYSVDGERVTRVANVSVDAAPAAVGGANGPGGAGGPGAPAGSGGSGGLPLTLVGVVVAVLVVVGFGVYRWRSR